MGSDPSEIKIKPGDVHDVAGATQIYRALNGDHEPDAPNARHWLRPNCITGYQRPQPARKIAVRTEKP
ncbi:hypothetical protein [Actibacterium ureilyticum]|uniref:hypothetical protein n=1 Tax=Actibacterium ureilyticum TaxID=1590614 RepID=UPI001140D0DD|nr:hypothetical protein [Actibacterium ureilyticum]